MTTEQGARLVLGLLLATAACRDSDEPTTHRRRPYASSSGADVSRTVQVRNNCPEAVVIAVAEGEPLGSTPTMTLRSTRIESVTVEQGQRIWLRYDGRFDPELSLAPTGPVEIGFQCNAIYDRNGGL